MTKYNPQAIPVPMSAGPGMPVSVDQRSPLSLSLGGIFSASVQFEFSPLKTGDFWMPVGDPLGANGLRSLAAGKASRVRANTLSFASGNPNARLLSDLSLDRADYERMFTEDVLEVPASVSSGAELNLSGDQTLIAVYGDSDAVAQVEISLSETGDDWHPYKDPISGSGLLQLPKGLAERVRVRTTSYSSGTPQGAALRGFTAEIVENDLSAAEALNSVFNKSEGTVSTVYAQDIPDPGGNIFDSLMDAYMPLRNAPEGSTKILYLFDNFAPVSNFTMPLASPACQLVPGPTASGNLTFVADNGNGDSEIQGADFVALGFTPKGGDSFVIEQAAVNGNETVVWTSKAATNSSLVIEGVVLTDEGPTAADVIWVWDFREINLESVAVPQTTFGGRYDFVAIAGSRALITHHRIRLTKEDQPDIPFIVPNNHVPTWEIEGFAYLAKSTQTPLVRLGSFSTTTLRMRGNFRGMGFSTSGLMPPRRSPAPVIQFPTNGDFAGLQVFSDGGARFNKNVCTGEGFLVFREANGVNNTQWGFEEQPSFINLNVASGDRPEQVGARMQISSLRPFEGRHIQGTATFYPAGTGIGPRPEIEMPGIGVVFPGFQAIRITGSTSNDAHPYLVLGFIDTNRIQLDDPVIGTEEATHRDLVSEVATPNVVIHEALFQSSFMYGLEDGATYYLESAFYRHGEEIEIKSNAKDIGTDITIMGMPAVRAPLGADELIDGATSFVLQRSVQSPLRTAGIGYTFAKFRANGRGVAAQAFGAIFPVDGSQIVDGESFVLDDGVNPAVTFEYDSDASVVESNTLRAIAFTGADDLATILASTAAAITAAPVLDISVDNVNSFRIRVLNDTAGSQGNVAIIDNTALFTFFGMWFGEGGLSWELVGLG